MVTPPRALERFMRLIMIGSSLLLFLAHQRLDRKISSMVDKLEKSHSNQVQANVESRCAASKQALLEAEHAIEEAQEKLSDYQNSLVIRRRVLPTAQRRFREPYRSMD
jgi:hypothetical protein